MDAGSRGATAHAHQCCRFQGYPKAIPSRIKLTMRKPASMTTDKGSRCVTSYFYSALYVHFMEYYLIHVFNIIKCNIWWCGYVKLNVCECTCVCLCVCVWSCVYCVFVCVSSLSVGWWVHAILVHDFRLMFNFNNGKFCRCVFILFCNWNVFYIAFRLYDFSSVYQ